MFGKIQSEFFITKCWNQNKLLLYNDDLSNWLIWRGIRRENTIPLARNTTSKISNCLSTFSYTLNIGCFKYWFHYRWLESHSYSLLLPSNKDLQLSFVKKKKNSKFWCSLLVQSNLEEINQQNFCFWSPYTPGEWVAIVQLFL